MSTDNEKSKKVEYIHFNSIKRENLRGSEGTKQKFEIGKCIYFVYFV